MQQQRFIESIFEITQETSATTLIPLMVAVHTVVTVLLGISSPIKGCESTAPPPPADARLWLINVFSLDDACREKFKAGPKSWDESIDASSEARSLDNTVKHFINQFTIEVSCRAGT